MDITSLKSKFIEEVFCTCNVFSSYEDGVCECMQLTVPYYLRRGRHNLMDLSSLKKDGQMYARKSKKIRRHCSTHTNSGTSTKDLDV